MDEKKVNCIAICQNGSDFYITKSLEKRFPADSLLTFSIKTTKNPIVK
jgi:hypothetical protein